MKAVIVSPYFKTLGGGERYALTFAQALLDKGWQVDLTVSDPIIIDDARKRFSLPLGGINQINLNPFINSNFIKKWLTHRQYDLIFWFFDGAIPLMLGKNNILHIQIPFTKTFEKPLLGLVKKQLINLAVCNSIFTQKITKKVFNLDSVVWYPPIGTDNFTPAKKEKFILSVGRFEKSMTEKRQDVMIDCFKKMIDSGLKGWKFVLAGGVYPGRQDYLEKLVKQAKNYPITFEVNATFDELVKIYAKSAIFWHAAGYGYDEVKNPEKMEHFGMTTVEAMASGCVPIVIGKGGQKEVVEDGKNGFLCYGKDDLIAKTFRVIGSDKIFRDLSAQAILRAGVFSTDNFRKQVYDYIELIK